MTCSRSSDWMRGCRCPPCWHRTRLGRLAVVETDDHGGVCNQDGVVTALGRKFQPTSDRRDLHRTVRQLLGYRCSIHPVRIRHRDHDVDEHVVGGLAQHPEEAEAGMSDGVRDGALGGLGGVVLKANLAANTRSIFADKRAVKQILINLLTNGVKFTPRDW